MIHENVIQLIYDCYNYKVFMKMDTNRIAASVKKNSLKVHLALKNPADQPDPHVCYASAMCN